MPRNFREIFVTEVKSEKIIHIKACLFTLDIFQNTSLQHMVDALIASNFLGISEIIHHIVQSIFLSSV